MKKALHGCRAFVVFTENDQGFLFGKIIINLVQK